MTSPNQQFYERALAAYNDRLGPVVQRLRLQQMVMLGLSVALVVAIGFSGFMGYLVATRPVEIVKVQVGGDATGRDSRQLAGVTAGSVSERDRLTVEQSLGNYIKSLKTVSADADMMVANIGQAQTMSSALVVNYLKTYFQVDNPTSQTSPFVLANRYRVAVDLKTVQRITDSTYRVDWLEHYRDAKTGAEIKTERWNSTITFSLLRPDDVPAQMNRLENPLALMVVGLEWTKEQ